MTERTEVIDVLNGLIAIEMAAINQYFVHAKICESRGIERIAARLRAASMEEMRDVENLIDRVLLLGGLPNLQRTEPFQVGETVTEQLDLHSDLERHAIDQLKEAVRRADLADDVATSQLLRPMVAGEEKQLDWLRTQLELIDQLGEAMYVSQQLHE